MGAKYYHTADRPKKIKKRLTQTRTWWRSWKWVAYHAHPTFVPGHPFKGGDIVSSGQLTHPDAKRFQIGQSFATLPPNPVKTAHYAP